MNFHYDMRRHFDLHISQTLLRNVQLSPQDVDLIASPNHEAVVEFDVALADVPVDIYFLLDLSGSMANHQQNLYKYACPISLRLYGLW